MTLESRIRDELDHLIVDAHGVPDQERDEWARRLALAAKGKSTAPTCTGVTANYCPVHGLCTCQFVVDERSLDDPGCPLHGERSRHPIE